jgi:hypothetical protein
VLCEVRPPRPSAVSLPRLLGPGSKVDRLVQACLWDLFLGLRVWWMAGAPSPTALHLLPRARSNSMSEQVKV